MFWLQVGMSGVSVSADAAEPVVGSTDAGIFGQSVVSGSSDTSSINYWLFILATVLLVLLWLCCLVWVREILRLI